MAKTVGLGVKPKKNETEGKELKALKEELVAVKVENEGLKKENSDLRVAVAALQKEAKEK